MAKHAWLDPSSFFIARGDIGCLLLHGFTGSPPEMRLLGEYLAERDVTVSAPLLRGHGTEPEDLNRCRWQDWMYDAEQALEALRARCSTIFAAGLSMGALLTLYLGFLHSDLAGLVTYSPAILAANKLIYLSSILKYVLKSRPKEDDADSDLTDPKASRYLWHYEIYPTWGAHELLKLQRAVRKALPGIQSPTLIFQSTGDRSIDLRCGQIVYDEIGAEEKELVILHHSGHAITVDSEREAIFAKTYAFLAAHTPEAGYFL